MAKMKNVKKWRTISECLTCFCRRFFLSFFLSFYCLVLLKMVCQLAIQWTTLEHIWHSKNSKKSAWIWRFSSQTLLMFLQVTHFRSDHFLAYTHSCKHRNVSAVANWKSNCGHSFPLAGALSNTQNCSCYKRSFTEYTCSYKLLIGLVKALYRNMKMRFNNKYCR